MKLVNPEARIILRCIHCNDVFYTALRGRTICPNCKPISQKELSQILSFAGARVVAQTKTGARQLVA